MLTSDEKKAFSKRLALALRRASKPVDGATELATQFSLRHGSAVSPQTTHKWLTGRTVPTIDKIETLAGWLGVESHWLRFGSPAEGGIKKKKSRMTAAPSAETIKLAELIQTLPANKRYLIEELVVQLLDEDV